MHLNKISYHNKRDAVQTEVDFDTPQSKVSNLKQIKQLKISK